PLRDCSHTEMKDYSRMNRERMREVLMRDFPPIPPEAWDSPDNFMAFVAEQQARDLERAKQARVYLRDKFMENAPDREMEEAARLGRELLHDLDGPLRISKMRRIEERVEPTVEAQAVADGHDPASLLDRMTSTGAGCKWLLGRWARLAAKVKHWELWGW